MSNYRTIENSSNTRFYIILLLLFMSIGKAEYAVADFGNDQPSEVVGTISAATQVKNIPSGDVRIQQANACVLEKFRHQQSPKLCQDKMSLPDATLNAAISSAKESMSSFKMAACTFIVVKPTGIKKMTLYPKTTNLDEFYDNVAALVSQQFDGAVAGMRCN
jgi:hypothetical protein